MHESRAMSSVVQEILDRKDKPSYAAIVVVLCVTWSCTQLAWAVQNGNVTPKLRGLGVADEDIPQIWIAGPLSGFFTQPLVGWVSDTYLEGRRKPMCYFAIAAIAISLVCFGFAADVTTTILCFWCLDISINCLMDPTRALLANLLPDVAMQTRANFSFVFAGGLARGLGFLMGSYTSDGDPSLRMDVVFCGAALYVAVVGFASVLWLPEASTHAQSSNNFAAEAVGGISLVAQSKLLRLAFVAQMLAYLAWCAIFMFGAEWLAEYAFDGGTDPSSSDFVWALGWANLTLAGMSVLSALLSLALPGLPLSPLWGAALLSMALCLLVAGAATMLEVHSVWLCVPILLLGFTWVCTDAIPWLMVCEEIAFNPAFDGYGGRVVAAFNISQCIPGIICAFLYGPLQHVTGSLAPLLLFGSGTTALGSAVAWLTGTEMGALGYETVGGDKGDGEKGEGERKDGKDP